MFQANRMKEIRICKYNRTSHLQMILMIAGRLSSNSIIMKRYCITLAGVFLVLARDREKVPKPFPWLSF